LAGRVEELHWTRARLWAKTISSMGREKPGLAEQIHLVRPWNAELGCGKKKNGEVEPHWRKPTGRLRARIDRG
jgi:hypothetical protein